MAKKLSYEQGFALLNRNLRWEVADLLKDRNLALVNQYSEVVETSNTFYARYAKRWVDVVVSGFALVILLPINLVIAVATVSSLGFPLFFHQERLGKDGELFVLTKFRNMREEFDENGHPLPGEMRVTRLGRFLRASSLDELLNFWSVLKGDMSLIGPRPLVPEYYERYSRRHKCRMAVKPGIECPPRSKHIVIDSYQDQFENDVWYVENVSFITDIKLLFRLLLMVIDRRQASKRSTATKGSFMGYCAQTGKVIDSYHVPDWALDHILELHNLEPKALQTRVSVQRMATQPRVDEMPVKQSVMGRNTHAS